MGVVQMPDPRRRSCRQCGRHETEVGPISWAGYCGRCGAERLTENMDGIHFREGPAHERRRYGIAVKEFGPRVALAMKKAGVFGPHLLDDQRVDA
jgi:hypothetical protein